jgi:hypothetical protein
MTLYQLASEHGMNYDAAFLEYKSLKKSPESELARTMNVSTPHTAVKKRDGKSTKRPPPQHTKIRDCKKRPPLVNRNFITRFNNFKLCLTLRTGWTSYYCGDSRC